MLDNDPRRNLLIACLTRIPLGLLLIGSPFILLGWNATAAGFAVLLSVGCALFMAKPIMELAGELMTTFSRAPLEKYQGRYYAFAGVQLRVVPVGAQQALWFVDRDVLAVLGEKPSLMLESLYDAHEYDRIPGTRWNGFSEEGVDKLLRASRHHEAGRMRLWIQREVVKPHRNRLALAARREKRNGGAS